MYEEDHPNAAISFHASGMILFIHSDASYLLFTKVRSRASGVFFLSDTKPDEITLCEYTPIPNGFIFIMCKILRNIMASESESEYGALFLNGQSAVLIRTTLIGMHHPQPPTQIQVDNSRAVGIAKNIIKQKRSKIMDIMIEFSKNTSISFGNPG